MFVFCKFNVTFLLHHGIVTVDDFLVFMYENRRVTAKIKINLQTLFLEFALAYFQMLCSKISR